MKAKFIKAVNDNDVVSVRLSLANELMLDPRGISFAEMKNFAETQLSDLYEIDNKVTFSTNSADWNEDFLFQVKNELDSNFSKEHLEFYERVAKTVLKEKAENLEKEESKIKDSSCHKSKSDNVDSCNQVASNNKKKIYATITVGGAAAAITGVCISKTVLASFGVAGMILGSILLYNESKK